MSTRATVEPAAPTVVGEPAHAHPSASFSATLRVRLDNRAGSFARLATAIGKTGGLLGAIDVVRVERTTKVRDVTVLATDAPHIERIVAIVEALDGIDVLHVSDRTFLHHLGGKIEITPRSPLKTRDDLSMAYTPGVARVSSAIAEDPAKVWTLTIKQHTVAVVSDGTAVLGLGDIGPEAALPVMEGKSVLPGGAGRRRRWSGAAGRRRAGRDGPRAGRNPSTGGGGSGSSGGPCGGRRRVPACGGRRVATRGRRTGSGRLDSRRGRGGARARDGRGLGARRRGAVRRGSGRGGLLLVALVLVGVRLVGLVLSSSFGGGSIASTGPLPSSVGGP